MPRPRRASKRHRGDLQGFDSIDLLLGPPRQERWLVLREAWFHNRRELMGVLRAGLRPAGWWHYEAGHPEGLGDDPQPAVLARMGELDAAEIAELRAEAYEFGALEWEIWVAVAGALGIPSGPAPRANAEEPERAEGVEE